MEAVVEKNTFSLNGNDWILTGWYKNQWRLFQSMELGIPVNAQVGPVQATVPGAVQSDLIREGLLPDPNFGLDSNAGEWVNNREWIFHKKFDLPSDAAGYERYILRFDGLDHHGEIRFNDREPIAFSGMFLPVEIDVTGSIRTDTENSLQIVFYQTPETEGQIGYSNQIDILKSRFNYVWDWCPRIVPVGIWEDVTLICINKTRIIDFFPKTRVTVDDTSDESRQKQTKTVKTGCPGEIEFNLDMETFTPGTYDFLYSIRAKNGDTNSLGAAGPAATTPQAPAGKEVYPFSAAKSTEKRFTEKIGAGKRTVRQTISLEQVELWWPNGSGNQPLYDIELSVFDENGRLCDKSQKQIGFKSARFVPNPNGPADARPYTLTINGKRVFLRGVNWVPISPFYGTVTREQYRNYLKRFRYMNCNILRVWGGAVLEKQDFYEVCDELGLMVWQEFPQSSSGLNNSPPENPALLRELEQVAAVYLTKRRHHVSHIIWCGGNELMWEDYKPIDEHHINIKMLKTATERLDPEKYFLPSSSSGPAFQADEARFGEGVHHDVHGPWRYMGEPDHYRFFNGDDALFRSETGCPGISRKETLERYRDSVLPHLGNGSFDLWPPDYSNPYWVHRGSWWIQLEELTLLFGPWADDGSELESYIQAGRFLQAEALRYDIEATRRREPEASGFIIWMGNEPFPNNANTSIIEYDGTPKPAYYWVRECYASLHVSARYAKIAHTVGETIQAEIYLHDENACGRTEENRLTVTAEFFDIHGTVLQQKEWSAPGPELGGKPVSPLGTIEWQTTAVDGGLVLLRLSLSESQAAGTAAVEAVAVTAAGETTSVEKEAAARNDYFFTIDGGGGGAAGRDGEKPAGDSAPASSTPDERSGVATAGGNTTDESGAAGRTGGRPFQPLRRLPKASIKITPKNGVVELQNISAVAAVGLFLYDNDASRFTGFEPGYFSLLPNEDRKVGIVGTDIDSLFQTLRIEGFNIDSNGRE